MLRCVRNCWRYCYYYYTCDRDRADPDSDRRFCFLFFLACRLLLDVLLECCRWDSSSDAMCSLKSRTRSASSVIALNVASDSSRGRTYHSRLHCESVIHQWTWLSYTPLNPFVNNSDEHEREQRPAATTLFHRQEWDLVIEPSVWPAQLYGTVYQQQFVKLTACIRLGASSKHICLLYVSMTD